MSGSKDIIIQQLRADVARLEAALNASVEQAIEDAQNEAIAKAEAYRRGWIDCLRAVAIGSVIESSIYADNGRMPESTALNLLALRAQLAAGRVGG